MAAATTTATTPSDCSTTAATAATTKPMRKNKRDLNKKKQIQVFSFSDTNPASKKRHHKVRLR